MATDVWQPKQASKLQANHLQKLMSLWTRQSSSANVVNCIYRLRCMLEKYRKKDTERLPQRSKPYFGHCHCILHIYDTSTSEFLFPLFFILQSLHRSVPLCLSLCLASMFFSSTFQNLILHQNIQAGDFEIIGGNGCCVAEGSWGRAANVFLFWIIRSFNKSFKCTEGGRGILHFLPLSWAWLKITTSWR